MCKRESGDTNLGVASEAVAAHVIAGALLASAHTLLAHPLRAVAIEASLARVPGEAGDDRACDRGLARAALGDADAPLLLALHGPVAGVVRGAGVADVALADAGPVLARVVLDADVQARGEVVFEAVAVGGAVLVGVVGYTAPCDLGTVERHLAAGVGVVAVVAKLHALVAVKVPLALVVLVDTGIGVLLTTFVR